MDGSSLRRLIRSRPWSTDCGGERRRCRDGYYGRADRGLRAHRPPGRMARSREPRAELCSNGSRRKRPRRGRIVAACGTKRTFVNIWDAEATLKTIRRKAQPDENGNIPIRWYQCHVCSFYHLTHHARG